MIAPTSHRSLRGRLALGLGLVAILGSIMLLGLVAIEYVAVAEEPLSWPQLAHEVADHVLAPVLVLLGLVAIAGARVINRAIGPLQSAAADVDRAAQHAPRGARIDYGEFPLEAQPFAASVNRLLERLDAVAEAQEAFAADAAHELKTPLTILALELERLPPDTARPLREDVAALARLVDQLLLMAGLNAQSTAESPREIIEPVLLAEDIVTSMAPLAVRNDRSIALENNCGVAFPGRREAVTAALRTLTENALRVTPPGGTVTVIAGPGPRLAVRDEGIGLSNDELKRLSRRGERADHASTSGAGLGLSIVSKIMAAHDGFVRAVPERREIELEFRTRTDQ